VGQVDQLAAAALGVELPGGVGGVGVVPLGLFLGGEAAGGGAAVGLRGGRSATPLTSGGGVTV